MRIRPKKSPVANKNDTPSLSANSSTRYGKCVPSQLVATASAADINSDTSSKKASPAT